MSFSSLSNLSQRLIVSGGAVIVLLTLIYLSHHPLFAPLFAIALACVAGFALWEYYHISEVKGFHPLIKIGLFTTTAYVMASFVNIQEGQSSILPTFILALSFLMSFTYFFLNDDQPLGNLAITTFGIIYLAIPLTYLLNINFGIPLENGRGDGRWWVIFTLAVTKMTDTGAFFIGKSLGRTKLAEHISPKKTIEGAMGGMVFAVVTSFLFPYLIYVLAGEGSFYLELWESIILGILIGVLAQIGDLGESVLKRDAGVKDSNQLPGLGGMLDMVDSLVFTIPLVYFYLLI
jgi:phosphatidate cytidylyltransferase